MSKKISTFQLAGIGLMAALVFVSNMISFNIPVPIGPATRIHLGNIFCLLSGLLLGAFGGGFAAGIGSFLYDLISPQYIASSPFTFLFKFLLAFVCAKIAYSHGSKANKVSLNIIAGIVGSLTYIVLYLGKTFIEKTILYRMEIVPALIAVWPNFGASAINATIAVVIAIPLCIVVRKALKAGNLLEKLQ